ncbi:ABC transporter permease [Sporosarcina jeotgali]|uniref:ABC transporter permease n=1 Tax=Sporosarcina jeotgali TaxID=3020056 RepID=A0ABZ0KWT5_9BACL|nr:ABC transporter permease [Sporosarcina sp. B2O-1]WOV84862.1 ABC transporter permease [Sporosarcina sp. B2O-1]
MKTLWNECRVEALRVFRNQYFIFWSLLIPIVFYVLYTKIMIQNVGDPELWEKHFLMSMTAFSVMGSSIMTLGLRLVQERNQGWTMYLRTTPVSGAVYFIAKMAGQTAVHAVIIIVIFASGGLINGISMPAIEWVTAGVWILLGAIPFLALGSLIGTMKKSDTASGISNLIYLTLAVMGGIWMPIESLPGLLQKMASWLPSYQYGAGAWSIIRGDVPNLGGILILIAYTIVFMVLSIQRRRLQEAI